MGDNDSSGKGRFLILGGCGFIGRYVVAELVSKNLASKIRVVDKVPSMLAYLSTDHKKVFEDSRVEFKQANLAMKAHVARAFQPVEEESSLKWDYVINLAGKTEYGCEDSVYQQNVYDMAVQCAEEAVKHGIKRWVEVSTAQVYESEKKKSTESSKLKPWTNVAKFKLKVEEALRAMKGLNLVIVRPALVYGCGDVTGLTPRIICGAVYPTLKETMKFLWTGDLRCNTVHVTDVARALVFLSTQSSLDSGSVFNLADTGDTNQDVIAKNLAETFKIKTSFVGGMLSAVAMKIGADNVTNEANDKHMEPWGALCKQHGIAQTPLSPFIDKELLLERQLSIDGTAITKLGFQYNVPKVTLEEFQNGIKYFIDMKLFPPIL